MGVRMDQFLKMDIFFAVTTVAVLVLSTLAGLVLYRLLRILEKVDEVSGIVQEEGERIRADIAEVRAGVKREALKAGHALGLLGSLVKPPRRRKKPVEEGS